MECFEELSAYHLKEFTKSIVWKALLNELKGREEFLYTVIKNGPDSEWPDENIRGRVNELDFFRNLPYMLLQDLQLDNSDKRKEV